MPKQKTSKAAKKRFKLTAAGKLMRRHAMKSHNFESKSPKRKRALGKEYAVDASDEPKVLRMLGRR